MSLDLGETFLQLERVAERLESTNVHRRTQKQVLLEAAFGIKPEAASEKTQFASNRPFLAAQVTDGLLGKHGAKPCPPDHVVVSVDGSHIDVDRHMPISCYVINLGACILTYGANPGAHLFNRPELVFQEEELYLTDPLNVANQEAVQGPLLGLLRTVKELKQLAKSVRELPPDLPVLALMDGSLVLWPLSGSGYRPFIRQAIIQNGLLPALDELQRLSRGRPVTLAAYVSLPRSTEVVNAIRCCLCCHELSRCRQSCSNHRSTQQPCDMANNFLDRELFQDLLEPGERSPLYRTNSSVSREYYGRHQVYFYYLNAGEEIARVEIPQWVAQRQELLDLGHSLILDQSRRGQGYPVTISEAHEQAVIKTADRQSFRRVMAEVLEQRGLPAYASQKDRSKRMPWL